MDISEKIKIIRSELGFSQFEFTKKINNVSQSAVGKYEKGERTPDFDFVFALVKNLKVNPSWLFLDIEPMFIDDEFDFLSENNFNLLKELSLLMSQAELNNILEQILNQRILEKFVNEEQFAISKILKTLKIDGPYKMRPFLFLYYIFRFINLNKPKDIKSYKDYLILIVEKYNTTAFLSNHAVFTKKIKQNIKAIIELSLSEQECQRLITNSDITLQKLEEKMSPAMLKYHRKNNLSVFS